MKRLAPGSKTMHTIELTAELKEALELVRKWPDRGQEWAEKFEAALAIPSAEYKRPSLGFMPKRGGAEFKAIDAEFYFSEWLRDRSQRRKPGHSQVMEACDKLVRATYRVPAA